MKTIQVYIIPIIWIIGLSFFSFLLLQITLQYIPYNTDVAFLRIKQDVIHLDYYKVAFFTHVYTSMFVMLAGFTQFSNLILKKRPLVHKRMGWLYVVIVVLFSGPSGFIMGIHANGGLSSQIAFCLLAFLWIYFTLMAILKIRKGNIREHKNFMYRSFALTLSAITLRLWKYILVAIFQPKPMDVYMIVAWLAWVLNLLLVEIYIWKTSK